MPLNNQKPKILNIFLLDFTPISMTIDPYITVKMSVKVDKCQKLSFNVRTVLFIMVSVPSHAIIVSFIKITVP